MAAHKTSDGADHWKSTTFYMCIVINIFCNVLRIVLYITAYLMRKCSSWFESLSDYLKTVEKAEDSLEKTIENRCNVYSFSNQTNKNEEPKEKQKVFNDTVNELMEKESNSYSNHIGENEEQKEANKVISDIMNELIDNVIKEYNVQSVFEHNIVAEHKLVNVVIANTINSKLNEVSDSQYYEVQQQPESQTPGESNDNSNSDCNEDKVKEKNITDKDIGSARVRRRRPIKNTAMLLITKTMNENKLKDKLFKFENELYKDKMSNKETPNGSHYQDIDDIFINKSDSFKREIKLSLKNEPEETDCITVSNNNDSKDTSNDSSSKYKNDSKNLDILKIIEPTENEWEMNKNEREMNENEWEMNENEKMSLKNKVDLWENNDGNKGRNPIIKTQNMIKEMNGEHFKNYNGYENKKTITKTENMDTKNNCERWANNDSYEYKKLITKTEKMLNLFEVKDDIFGLPSTFSLAHCVSEDLHNSVWMTADFKLKFGQMDALMDQRLRVNDVGHITHNEQHIFYLVVKRKMAQRPLLSSLEIALYNLRDKMNDLKLTKLAIPKHGLDSFNMIAVKELISKIFTLSNIEVIICLAPKLDIEHFNPPKVNYTHKQLWEMEKQTDIIMFINMSTMYSENWNDKVVEHINAKYPFKERLLNDINIKPMAHGDLLMYKIDTEILFCILINPLEQNTLYSKCLEKAFLKMKSQLTGYRYFGIQQEPLNYKGYRRPLPLALFMLKSVFSNQNAEIWVCGDTEQHKAYHYQQYKHIVDDAIEQNQKRNSKTYTKSKNRQERRRKYSNNSRHESSEKHNSKNIPDVNTLTNLNQEQSFDNYITENWDN